MAHQTVSDKSPKEHPNYYEILGLSHTFSTSSDLSPQQLKAAYRRALLLHHPDKFPAQVDRVQSHSDRPKHEQDHAYAVDQISNAYGILSVPKLRAQYDRDLKLTHPSAKNSSLWGHEKFRTGFETVDLDDLEHGELEEQWYRSCRCGDRHGFLIRRVDLEEASGEGELHVGCQGCSLWLRVLFGVIDVNADDASPGTDGNG